MKIFTKYSKFVIGILLMFLGSLFTKAQDGIAIYNLKQVQVTIDQKSISACIDKSLIITGVTASYCSSIAWSTTGNGFFVQNTDLNPTYNLGSNDIISGKVSLIVTANGIDGCSSIKDTISVTLDRVTFSINDSNFTTCQNISTHLKAKVLQGTGGYSYEWSPATNLDKTIGNDVVFTPGTSTPISYHCTVTDVLGCKGYNQLQITVNPSPTVNISNPKPSLCLGGSVSLMAAQAANFSWNTGDITPTISKTPTTTTTYSVTGTNPMGCWATASAVVQVNPIPTVTITKSSQYICLGNAVTFSANSNATTLNWNDGSTGVSNITVKPQYNSAYYVTASNAGGCSSTASTSITVYSNPGIVISPNSVDLCGTGKVATMTASSTKTLNYVWSTKDTQPTLSMIPTASTMYSVSGTDSLGCVGTATVIVTINPLPTIIATATPTNITIGQMSQLTATGASLYNWSNGLGSGNSQIVSPMATTMYFVTGTDYNNCSATAKITVKVNPLQTTIPVTGIKILDGSQNLQVGQSFLFHAQTIPMNAISQQIIWYYINANNSNDKGTLGTGSAYTLTPSNVGNFWVYAFSNEYKISGKDTVWYHDSVNVVVMQHITVLQVFANISGSMKVLVGATDKSASAYVYPSTATNKAVTWSTSNSSIATIDQNGVITGIAKGNVNIVVASVEDPNKFATFIVEVVEPAVDKLQLKGAIEYSDYIISYITPNQLGTNAGQYSQTLMSALKDQNTVSKVVYNAVASSQIEVTVSTVALEKAIYDFKNSLVGATEITSILLNNSTLNASVTAAPYMLSATILPSNATYKTLLWKSTNTSIASVDQNGLVTFVGAGTAVISATATDGSAVSANCSVNVSVPVESIYIPQTIGLKVGEITPVTAFVLPLNASNKLVKWTSSDPSIATVDTNGMVTAISVGSAKIIAQSVDGQKTAVCITSVSSIAIAMTKITLPQSPMQMIVGESKSIDAIITPFNATNKTIFWKTSNMASLAVDYTGVVTAIGIDTVIVYAFNQDKTIIDSIEVFISASKAPEILPIEPVVVKTGTTSIIIALSDLVIDDKTSFSNLTFIPSTDANFTVTIHGDSLVITPNNAQTALSGTIKIVVVDQDNQSSIIDVPITVSSNANTAPVLSAFPNQSIIVGGTFMPVTLSMYVKDDYTKPNDIVWTIAANTNLQASIAFGVLTVTPKLSSWIGVDSLLVTAIDLDGLTKSMYIKFTVSNKENQPPVLLQIPTQEQTTTVSFQPINLSKYVTDDYTASSYIVWSVSKSNKLNVSIVNGKAYFTVIDKNWVGSEMITFTATDQAGLSSNVSVLFNQNVKVAQTTWTGKPEVSFIAERTKVGKKEKVYFHGSITGDALDGQVWTFIGGNPAISYDLNPVVTYNENGKYDVLFAAGNNGAIDSSNVKGYITVIGITTPDTTICKGSPITLSVSDKSLTKYIWSTGATTATITITPTANTKYSVTAQSGLFKYSDTVLVSISKPVSLGTDSAICYGSSVQYTLTGFSIYKWNNNSSLTSNSFTVTSAQTVSVETKDAFNCVSTASVQISVNALPTVDLGANDSICPSSPKVLDAGSGLASYNWSTGIATQTITVTSSAVYLVTLTNANGCKNTDAVKIVVKKPYAEQLGVATVLGSNKIVLAWNRTSNKDIKMYTVLRETSKAGIFEPIGTRQFSDTSYVVDNSASPFSQTYTYKLQTTDNCLDTISSKKHVTMLLQAVYSESTNANQLTWNGYEGVPLSTFNIYRNGKRIKSLAASSGNNSYPYNDVEGIKGDLYQIRYDLPDSIFTTQLKSDSGPFSQSLSNLAESELTESELAEGNAIAVYPNPAYSIATVILPIAGNYSVDLFDALGRHVLKTILVEKVNSVQLSLSELQSGVYILRIQGKDSVKATQFVKE